MSRAAPSRVLAIVGSYTHAVPHAPDAHGAGLTILEVDLITGTSHTRFHDDSIRNPAFLCIDAPRRLVYVLSEVWGGSEGVVSALHFDRDYDRVVSRSEVATGGTVPAYVSIVDGFVLVANYGSGSLASFRLSPDGHLDECACVVPLWGSGHDPSRQSSAHPHCVIPHPSNGQIYAADLGTDKLLELRLDRSTGILSTKQEYPVAPGFGPRHLAFGASGRSALVVGELTSRLGVWAVGSAGELHEQQDLPMLPDGNKVRSTGADVVVSADGRRAFASNRGHDSIAVYRTAVDGTFRLAHVVPTAATPRSMALACDDSHILVANQDADSVRIFGLREDIGLVGLFDVAVATPACIKCVDPLLYE